MARVAAVQLKGGDRGGKTRHAVVMDGTQAPGIEFTVCGRPARFCRDDRDFRSLTTRESCARCRRDLPAFVIGDRVEVSGMFGDDVVGWRSGTVHRFERAEGGYVTGTWRARVQLDDERTRRPGHRFLTRYAMRDGSPLPGADAEIRKIVGTERDRSERSA